MRVGWGAVGKRERFYVLIIVTVITVCDSTEDSERCKPTQDTHTVCVITYGQQSYT